MSVNQIISSLGNEIPVDKRIIGSIEARLIHNLEKNPVLLETDEKKYDATVLHEAARHEYEEYATKIIRLYPSFVSSVNVDGDTPLHFAARTGNTSILLKMLESRKAASMKINKQGETAFIIACVNNHVDAAMILVEETTSMTMVELNAAFSAKHPVIVDKVLERFPRLVSDVDKEQSTLLHKACKVGNLEMVRKLLDVVQSIAEIVNKDGLTPLHYAAMNGSVEILKEFLDKAPSSFNKTTQGTMETVFHLAIKQKNTKAFVFMAQRANIGRLLYNLDAEGNTLLHVAARYAYEECVKKIIDICPSSLVSFVNVDGDTPLHFAARTGNTSILVKMLKSRKAACMKINKQGETAFILACVNNHVDAAIILVEEATSMTMVELDAAFSAHHPVIVDKILERFPHLVIDVDKEQSTLLHKACKIRNLEMVRKLLDVDQRIAKIVNKDGLTPLHYAAMNGSVEILKEFLDKAPTSFNSTTQRTRPGPEHKQVGSDLQGTRETVFQLALKQKNTEAFIFMAERANIGKLLYNLDAEGNTVLHVATMHEYDEYVTTKIIELCPSLVSSVNVNGDTPLHFAARTGNKSILVKMLKSGEAAYMKINKQGETAFILACVNNHVDAAIVLVEEVSSITMVELDAAFSAKHPAIPDIILGRFPGLVFEEDEQQSTLLHKACLERNLEMVKMLLDVDQSIAEKMNKNGLTPLHCAAMTGSVEILKEFLNRTPSSFNVTTQGTMETVFHLAAKQKHIKAFTFMAESANIDKHLYEMAESANIGKLLCEMDAHDNTVLHVAASINSTYLVRYILKETTIDVTLKNMKGSAAVDLLDQNGKDFGQLSHWLRQDEGRIQRPSKYVKFAHETGEHNRNTNNGELLNSESFEKNLESDRRKKKEREMHSESLQNVRNTITIVAVLIASVAFTSGINPPGGVYQEGTFIGKATAGRTLAFKIFSIANNIALFTSLSIVTLLVSIISYRTNSLKMCVVIAHKMMWLAVASMVTSYTAAAWITVPHSQRSKWLAYTTAAIATVPVGSMFVYVTFMMVKHILKKQSLRGNESHGPASATLDIEAAYDTGCYIF